MNPCIKMLISAISYSQPFALIYIGYRAHIFDRKKFCFIKRPNFLMPKMKNLIFLKTMHDITTKIHHKVGFVNGQKIVGLKSQSSEVYFWREKLDEILPGQIGHCVLLARINTFFGILLTFSRDLYMVFSRYFALIL